VTTDHDIATAMQALLQKALTDWPG